MSTVPDSCAGTVTVREVLEVTLKLVAGVLPKATAVAPARLAPVRVIEAPPPVGPDELLSPLTLGAAASAVYRSAAEVAGLPRGVGTVTSTGVPGGKAGAKTLTLPPPVAVTLWAQSIVALNSAGESLTLGSMKRATTTLFRAVP